MNLLVKNGMVYDPTTDEMGIRDIAIEDGLIADPEIARDYRAVIDASDCIVTPGLIDFHVHFCYGMTDAGVVPDSNSFCCGITSVVDGGSTGARTFEIYHNSAVRDSQVDIYNHLLIASGGQISDRYPENMEAKRFDEEAIVKLFRKYPDNLKGIKMRLSKSILDHDTAVKAVMRAKEIAARVDTPLIIHVTDSPVPLDELAGYLTAGDVICHIYQDAGENTCLDENGRVLPGLWDAKARGVLFDACNGWKNFDLVVAQKAIEQGFLPDIISSDMNSSSNFLQPLHSLPRILSKYLDFGMTLNQVITAATLRPAQHIHETELASLAYGTTADLVVFKRKKKKVGYSDFNNHTFEGTQVLVPQMTIKAGKSVYCQADFL